MDRIETIPFGEFLRQIGDKTPAPGGGAVASAAGAVAAALARMVVSYSLGRKNLAEHQPRLEQASATLLRTAEVLLRLADEDAAAYGLVNELSRLPETDARRVRDYPAAVEAAVNVPRMVVGACCDLLRLLEELGPMTNRHLRSDLAIAAVLAEAAARSGWWNVRVNMPLIGDVNRQRSLQDEMSAMLAEAGSRRERVEAACGE